MPEIGDEFMDGMCVDSGCFLPFRQMIMMTHVELFLKHKKKITECKTCQVLMWMKTKRWHLYFTHQL